MVDRDQWVDLKKWLQYFVVSMFSLQPFLNSVMGSIAPQVEELVVLDLSILEQKHWFHIYFLLVIGGELNAYGGTGVYNGHKHHKWYMDG